MNITTNYSLAITFTKHVDLMPWFYGKHFEMNSSTAIESLKRYCSVPREVQLILLARFEDGRTYCKIKCPVNPLPIRGEFEAVSIDQIIKLLVREEWRMQERLPISLFQ